MSDTSRFCEVSLILYYITHLHLCDVATFYTEVCEEETLYNRGLNRRAYKTVYFAPYISSIHIKPYRPLFRSLVIKPRFADAAFCLLRLKLVLQKLDNTTKLSSPHRQHFRDYSCSSWSLERRKSGAPRVTCLRAVSS